jgi:peptidoglycan hydrolase-like protein with peptidoglycan-binding domain
VVVVALAVLVGCGTAAGAGSAPASSVEGTAPATTGSGSSLPPTTTAAEAPITKVALERTLVIGHKGPDVTRLQERLNALKFDVGRPDGFFGQKTQWAVWAYQALIVGLRGRAVDGMVSPQLWDRMQDPLGLVPQRSHATPNRVEVFLPAQAAVFYENNAVRVVTHVSSGSGQEWCAQPAVVKPYQMATTTTLPPGKRLRRQCGHSITPGGAYTIYRKEPGWWDIPLGRVYNPLYFNRGIAIHGFEEVPRTAASHGCIRIPMHVSEYVYDIYSSGDAVFVFDGEQEPEFYGAQPPPDDTPDPLDVGDDVWPPVPAADRAAAEKLLAEREAAGEGAADKPSTTAGRTTSSTRP